VVLFYAMMKKLLKKINKTVFPGIQGGPLMHVIAAKAQCFYEASTKEFIEYQKQVLRNIQAMIKVFKDNNYYLVTGGSDNHLLLININKTLGITGAEAQDELERIGIVVNKNTVPFETLSPAKASGIRIGSPAMTTKGFKEGEFRETAEIIVEALNNYKEGKDNIYLKKKVKSLLGD